ncbi:MAG: hypothetical protein RL291_269 [Pseudomonadota bacterium]
MKTKTVILLALAAVGLGVGGLAAMGKIPLVKKPATVAVATPASSELDLAQAVTVVRAVPQRFTETLAVTGTIVPRNEVLVGPEVEGLRITEILADEGQTVKQGEVLARLVFDTLDAQLAANTANIARATAAIAQARSNITAAEARVVEAKNAFDRAKTLKANGYTSEANYDQRDSAYKTAVANLAVTRDQLIAAEAEKTQLEAQRREIAWRRGKTDVVAPVDGVISRRTARVGGFAAGAGDALFRIIAKGEVELEAEVTETRMPRMKEGQKALVDLPGIDDIPGQVRLVSPEIDRASRLGKIRIFIGADPRVRIGAFARATIDTANAKGLGVPLSAVQTTEAGSTVQVVVDGRVKTQRVKTGLSMGNLVEITEGLREGDLVVAKAGTFLRDGDNVRAVETASPQSTSTTAPATALPAGAKQ